MSNNSRTTRLGVGAFLGAFALWVALVVPDGAVLAWPTYYDPNDSTQWCAQCHSTFKGRGALHDLHVGNGKFTGNCDYCHTGNGRDNPVIMWSKDDNFGCMGCHGRDYDETISQDHNNGVATFPTAGKAKMSGYGLRKQHQNKGVTTCSFCHGNPDQSFIKTEDVNPPYYAASDVNVTDSCNSDGTEDGTGEPNGEDAVGLDNDGDGVIDGADPDCAVEEVPPLKQTLARLGDVDGNAAADLAVIYTDPVGGLNYVSVKDTLSGGLIRQILAFGTAYTPVAVVGLPDFSGNGADEVAVAAVNGNTGQVLVRVFDALNGSQLSELAFSSLYPPEALAALPSFGGSGAWEVALLGVNSGTGQVLVRVKDASSGVKLSDVYWPPTYDPRKMAVLDNFGGTGADEIAVLGVNPATGQVLARVKDASSGIKLSDVHFSKAYSPRDMVVVPSFGGTSAEEIAVLGVESATSRVMIRVKDTSSGVKLNDVFYSKSYTPQMGVPVASFGGTAAAELGVVGIHDTTGQVLVRSKDASSDATQSDLLFSKNYPPEAVVTVPHLGGSSADEIALLGKHVTDGTLLIRIKDAQSGNLLSTIPVP